MRLSLLSASTLMVSLLPELLFCLHACKTSAILPFHISPGSLSDGGAVGKHQ